MPRNIADLCSNALNVRSGERYGIEVEGEGCAYDRSGELDWTATFHKFWTTTADGSLRNGGIEFVSKPLTRLQVPQAIDSLWPYIHTGRVTPSVRTGVHIHASCLGLNTDHVRRILQHYALVEPLLFAVAGPEREENIYCIPWYRAVDEPEEVRDWLAHYDGETGRGSERGPCKYSALYVAPLTRYGTIEFRHAPTWADSRSMHRWFSLVQAVWGTHATTYNVLEEWRRLGPTAFVRSIAPFDWLPTLDESVYESADVEHVASLLFPPTPVLSPTWGRAPELRVPGQVAALAATPPRRRGTPAPTARPTTFDDMVREARHRERERMMNVPLTAAALTVNAVDPVQMDLRVAEQRMMAQQEELLRQQEAEMEELAEDWPDFDDEDEEEYETFGTDEEEEV